VTSPHLEQAPAPPSNEYKQPQKQATSVIIRTPFESAASLTPVSSPAMRLDVRQAQPVAACCTRSITRLASRPRRQSVLDRPIAAI
jgi:hypothetical protein